MVKGAVKGDAGVGYAVRENGNRALPVGGGRVKPALPRDMPGDGAGTVAP